MCAAPSAFVCIEINAIRNMELFLCCFKHTAIILHITVNARECQLKPMCSSSLHVCVCVCVREIDEKSLLQVFFLFHFPF